MPWVAVFVPLALLLARDLNALALGEVVPDPPSGVPLCIAYGLATKGTLAC
jgi:hypothetical protein